MSFGYFFFITHWIIHHNNRAEKLYDPFWNRGVFVSQVDFPVCVHVCVPAHSFLSLLLQVLQIHSQAHMLEKQKEGCCTSAEQRMDALCHRNATSTVTFLTLFILKWNWCSAVTMLGNHCRVNFHCFGRKHKSWPTFYHQSAAGNMWHASIHNASLLLALFDRWLLAFCGTKCNDMH